MWSFPSHSQLTIKQAEPSLPSGVEGDLGDESVNQKWNMPAQRRYERSQPAPLKADEEL